MRERYVTFCLILVLSVLVVLLTLSANYVAIEFILDFRIPGYDAAPSQICNIQLNNHCEEDSHYASVVQNA